MTVNKFIWDLIVCRILKHFHSHTVPKADKDVCVIFATNPKKNISESEFVLRSIHFATFLSVLFSGTKKNLFKIIPLSFA